MWSTLVICLGLTAHLHARIIGSSDRASQNVVSNPKDKAHLLYKIKPFDMDQALAIIASSCLTDQDHVELSGNIFAPIYARNFNSQFITQAIELIFHSELRAALGFAPLGPWTHYKFPSKKEIGACVTAEQYFDVITRNRERSLDSRIFLEKNFPPVIAFLDKRFPEIRQIFIHKTEEFARPHMGKTITIPAMKKMNQEFGEKVNPKLHDTISQMYGNDKCSKAEE